MASGSCLIGVDIGGTRLRVRAEDTQSRARGEALEVPVPQATSDLVAAVASLAKTAAEGREIESLAAGLPGHVRGDYCVWIPNLRFLDGMALADLLTERTGAPSHLINDAQATLLAETHEGAAQHHAHVVLVAVGTGIGGAYQINGELVVGANGCAGSFGWLPFSGAGRDDDHGQWERAASGQALEAMAEAFGGTQGLIAAAHRGDGTALQMMSHYGALLGEGIAGLTSILDPNVVILAGGLVSAFDLFGATLAAAVATHGSPTGRTVPVIPAALGSSAGIIGTLLWARRRLEGIDR